MLLLFAVISAILLVIFVSPNRFKPLIIEQVKNATGRDIIIDGNLSWSFFPYLGVKVNHMALKNPAGFNEKIFAEIDHATVNVKLLPLLHAQLESRGIILHGMKLHLIKNKNGKTNWQDFQDSTPVISEVKKNNHEEKIYDSSFDLAVSAIDISDATISWNDEQTHQTFNIEKFELHAKNINLNTPFPFSTTFSVKAENPEISGFVTLSSKISLNAEKQLYLFQDTELSAKINNVDLEIRGDVIANLNKNTLQVDDLSGQIANMMLIGRIGVTNITHEPRINGHVQINPTNMKQFLQRTGYDRADIKEIKNLSGNLDFTVKPATNVSANGQFKIDSIQTSKLTLHDVRMDMRYQDNILNLLPLTAKLYQGDLYSQIKIDLNGTNPHYAISANLSNIQAEPFLKELAGEAPKITLQGIGNVDLQITTAGDNSDKIVRNLNGSGKLNFNNGIINGVDIGYYIDSAYAFVKKQANTAIDTRKTTFGRLSATANIHDGVVSNNDMHFDSPRFDTTGKGKIDLVNKQMDYSLQTLVKKLSSQKNNLLNMYDTAIPIKIAGDLSDPKIRLDMEALIKTVGQKQFDNVKEKLQEQVTDKVKEQLKGKAGELLNNFLGN